MNKRTTLLVLALLFFGPVLVAWTWFFLFQDIRPGTVNQGELLDPPIDVGDLRLDERHGGDAVRVFADDWSVVILAPQHCDESCEQALYVTRQVWLRLNRDSRRVQRILLTNPDVAYPEDEHPDLRVFDVDDATLARFDASEQTGLDGERRVYLADPYGNLMLSYPLTLAPEMLNKDLKRLLKISEADKLDDE